MNEQLLLLISKQLEEINAILVRQEQRNTKKNAQGKMGRPTKEHIVLKYRGMYPNNRKMQCTRATGLSIKTVSKYWDLYEEKKEAQAGALLKQA